MDRRLIGLIKVRVVRGRDLAFGDARGSDPYVVLRLPSQKVKTSVKKKNVNPEWNEELTLSVVNPTAPIKLEVFDKDTFTRDDHIGDAEIDIQNLLEVARMDLKDTPDDTVIKTVEPTSKNCFVGKSCISWKNGRAVQDIILRLRNVDSGELELQLQWVNIPGVVL